jgi:predicted Ser/Thr protein kinase
MENDIRKATHLFSLVRSVGTLREVADWSVGDLCRLASHAINHHAAEGRDPALNLMADLWERVRDEDTPDEARDRYLQILDNILKLGYAPAFESGIKEMPPGDIPPSIFGHYVTYAKMLVDVDDLLIDPSTAEVMDKGGIDTVLKRVERACGLTHGKAILGLAPRL